MVLRHQQPLYGVKTTTWKSENRAPKISNTRDKIFDKLQPPAFLSNPPKTHTQAGSLT